MRGLPEHMAQRMADYLDSLATDQLSAIRGLQTRLAVIGESCVGPYLQPDSNGHALDLHDALRGDAVVGFSLNSSSYPELAAHTGGLLSQDLNTVSGQLLTQRASRRGLIVIDEFSALDGDQVLNLLARAREAQLSVLLATQELADLDRAAPGLRDQVLGIVGLRIAHRQDNPESAELLARTAGTQLVWSQTRQTTNSIIGSADTGLGSRHQAEQYVIHPNILKRLPTGHAALIRSQPTTDAGIVRVIPPAPPPCKD